MALFFAGSSPTYHLAPFALNVITTSLLCILHPFVMLHLVSGINSLYHFVNLILVSVLPFPIHLFLHPSLLPLLIHHCAYPQLPLSFIPGLKPTRFTNPTPTVSLISPGLHSWTIYGTVSSELSGFCFSILFLFRCRALD